MQLSVTIPDTVAARVLDGICGQYDYSDTIVDPKDDTKTIPNPETKAAFAKRMLLRWIKDSVKTWEANKAADVARQAKLDDVEAKVKLT